MFQVSIPNRFPIQIHDILNATESEVKTKRVYYEIIIHTINSINISGPKEKGTRTALQPRIAVLRVITSYRAVSTLAVLVIAGMTAIDLPAIERRMIFNARHSMTQPESTEAIRRSLPKMAVSNSMEDGRTN